jgi:O-antigen/teichoic acid export membrane protein
MKPKSEFISHVLTLAGGTGFAQLIPLLVAPFLTRLYTPGEYGILSLYVSTCAIISVVSTGRYELAILLPRKSVDADRVALLASSLAVVTGISVILLFIIFLKPIFTSYYPAVNINWFYLTPLTIISLGLYQTFTYRLNREKDYKLLAGSKIIKNSFTGLGQITLGYFGLSYWGLIIGKIAGEISSTGYLGKKIHDISQKLNIIWSGNRIKELAKEYVKFPKFNAFHAFTTAVSANMPIFILTTFFGASTAGLFGLSIRICYAPVSILAASVGQVFSRKISEIYKATGDISIFTYKTVRSLAAVGIIPFLILLLFAPRIFGFVFGAEWKMAGTFSQFLTAWYMLSFLVSPIIYIPMMLGRQKKAFIIEIISISVRFCALMAGVYYNNELISVLLYSLTGSVILIYTLLWIIKLVRNNKTSVKLST